MFIIQSGHDEFKYEQIAIRYHVTSYLLKPIQTEELKEAVCETRERIIRQNKQGSAIEATQKLSLLRNIAIKENFFTRLLENEYRSESGVNEQLEVLQLPLQSGARRVLVFSYTIEQQGSEASFLKESTDLFHSAAINIIVEVLSEFRCIVFSKDLSVIVAINNMDDDDDVTLRQLRALCNRLLLFFFPLFYPEP